MVTKETTGFTVQSVIGLVLACMVAVLGWALKENYHFIASQIESQRIQIQSVSERMAERDVLFAEIRTNQDHMIESQKRLEEKVDRLLREKK